MTRVGDESTPQVDQEVHGAAVAAMLVQDGYDTLHVLAQSSRQGDLMLIHQFRHKWLRNMSAIRKQLAKQRKEVMLETVTERDAIIGIPWCETNPQEFTVVIAHQVELEAIKPTH